jgi:uncharacterized protein (DUF1330 family)
MAAYVIARVKVTDPTRYQTYVQSTLPTIAKFGGRFVVRGGQTVTLEGPEETRRIVILEFSSLEQAQAWYNSDDYQTVRKLRVGAAEGGFLAVDGV